MSTGFRTDDFNLNLIGIKPNLQHIPTQLNRLIPSMTPRSSKIISFFGSVSIGEFISYSVAYYDRMPQPNYKPLELAARFG